MSKNERTEYNKFFCLNVKNGQFYYSQEIEIKTIHFIIDAIEPMKKEQYAEFILKDIN